MVLTLLLLALMSGLARTETPPSRDLGPLQWPVLGVLRTLAGSGDGACAEESRELLGALRNATYWAVRSKWEFLEQNINYCEDITLCTTFELYNKKACIISSGAKRK